MINPANASRIENISFISAATNIDMESLSTQLRQPCSPSGLRFFLARKRIHMFMKKKRRRKEENS